MYIVKHGAPPWSTTMRPSQFILIEVSSAKLQLIINKITMTQAAIFNKQIDTCCGLLNFEVL